MIEHFFDPALLLAQFKLPPQDINLLTFCLSKKPGKVAEWADELKLTQTKATSAELYKAVPEIAHLKTDAKSRFEMLEAVWPAVQHVAQELSKDFLNQPLMMPDAAQKAAIVAQALQKHLLDGYTVCVKELVDQKRLKAGQQELLQHAIFRAISCAGLLMLRNYQLYTPVPPGVWLRLHGLWQTAEHFEVQARPTTLPHNGSGAGRTVTDAYLRVVGLACLRPNQLPQNDLSSAYAAFESWSRVIKLTPPEASQSSNVYCLELSSDRGPAAKERVEAGGGRRLLEVDFNALVLQLEKLSGKHHDDEFVSYGTKLTVPVEMADTLLDHVVSCLSNSAQRFQQRRRAAIPAEACIGLIDCHFHISGNVHFDQFINPSDQAAGGSSLVSDSFSSLISSLSRKKDIDEDTKPARQTVFSLTIQNVSDGGYCAVWDGDLPNRVEAGEIIGLREQGRRSWSIGVVRWIRQIKGGSQLGIQILTTQPVPFGAAVTYDFGGYSDYMRAIHIPHPLREGQPPAILTASVPFQENARARLKQDDVVTEVRLSRCIFSTSRVKLFAFNSLASGV